MVGALELRYAWTSQTIQVTQAWTSPFDGTRFLLTGENVPEPRRYQRHRLIVDLAILAFKRAIPELPRVLQVEVESVN